jgi:alpha-galactosidase
MAEKAETDGMMARGGGCGDGVAASEHDTALPVSAQDTDAGTRRQYHVLRAGGTLVALDITPDARPLCLYAGVDLPNASPQEMELLATRQHAPGSASVPLRGSLINEIGTGSSGPSGLIAHRQGSDWAVDLRLAEVQAQSDRSITLRCEDSQACIAATHIIAIDPATGVLTCSTAIENLHDGELTLDWCAALCLPLDPSLDRIMSFTGRWSGEFQVEEIESFRGSILRENKAGRTSHDVFPGLIAKSSSTSETTGSAAGFHLAWSGNSRLRIDQHSDGRSLVQMGELLFPAEIRLAKGESYTTPDLIAAFSDTGIGGVSHAFHQHLCRNVLDPRSFAKPRPVHYNTWEAVYFDHKIETLLDLADKAAEVGAERFVLDDGWFGGRRNDSAGLGDWWVSEDVYPDGLHPIVDRVKKHGMEFGLWFEPEMVNPDSDLYRAHPDWVLGADGVEHVPFRGQLTLDLTKADVFDYLFDKITQLVSEYDIAYIKWDMNRDTHFPGSDGKGAMHRQTRAVYALIAKLRSAHPALEIESCSSGGARADFGILRHTDRLWTSDNNDARARHAIERGASHFFPLRVLGSHVGPETCHVTGRRFTMAFRAGTAIFGHMGMEQDLRSESAEDLATLKAAIALHKEHRALIHEGRLIRLTSAEHTNFIGSVAGDGTEAIFSYAVLESEPMAMPALIRFDGLDAGRKYRVRMVWPHSNPSISTPSIVDAADLMDKGAIFTGSALMGHGIQPPLGHPDACLIYHLEAVD